MSVVESMLKKAVEEKNKEREEQVQRKVKNLVDLIVDYEADIANLKEKVKGAKANLKELELPEQVAVEL